jgi:uncharacterized paraquat-inducible protein A
MNGYEDEEECPHCAAMIVPEIDYDDVVFCPKCHMIIREPEPEAPRGGTTMTIEKETG